MPNKKAKLTAGKIKKYDKIIVYLTEKGRNLEDADNEEIKDAAVETGIKNYSELEDEILQFIDSKRTFKEETVNFTKIEDEYDLTENTMAIDLVKQYLKDIKDVNVLSREEEKDLFVQYRNVSEEHIKKEIKEKIVKAHVRLVISIAKKYRGRGLDFIDLIQEGNVGLLKAMDKFNLERGCKFSTYAPWWIRQSITKAISEKKGTIREPGHVQTKYRKIKEAINQYVIDNGRKPNDQEISELTGLSVNIVEKYKDGIKFTSIDAPIGDQEDGITVGDTIEGRDELATREKEKVTLIQREALEKVIGFSSKELKLLAEDIVILYFMKIEVEKDGKTDIQSEAQTACMTDQELMEQFFVTKEKIDELRMRLMYKDNPCAVNLDELDENLLNLREVVVLSLSFGLVNNKLYELKEVASLMNLTEMRVNQICSAALDKLRGKVTNVNELKKYLNL